MEVHGDSTSYLRLKHYYWLHVIIIVNNRLICCHISILYLIDEVLVIVAVQYCVASD
jgi:hypothetical protein